MPRQAGSCRSCRTLGASGRGCACQDIASIERCWDFTRERTRPIHTPDCASGREPRRFIERFPWCDEGVSWGAVVSKAVAAFPAVRAHRKTHLIRLQHSHGRGTWVSTRLVGLVSGARNRDMLCCCRHMVCLAAEATLSLASCCDHASRHRTQCL